MTIRTRALVGLTLSVSALAVGYGSAFLPGGAPAWAPWAAALGIPGALVSTMTLGAARDGSIGRLVAPFAFVFVVLAGGFCLALALGAPDPADPTLWLGLPPRAAVILYGVGFLPLVVVPLAYALTFDELALRSEDWETIRERAAAGTGGPAPDVEAAASGSVSAASSERGPAEAEAGQGEAP
jgi:hypothetical protein